MSQRESFEAYWARVMPRHMDNARREWEALASGPIKGTLTVQTHEGLQLNIGTGIAVYGMTEKAVADKIVAVLEGSHLVGPFDSCDATEWQIVRKRAQHRLACGDHDFSLGAVVAIDIAIVRED